MSTIHKIVHFYKNADVPPAAAKQYHSVNAADAFFKRRGITNPTRFRRSDRAAHRQAAEGAAPVGGP